MVDRLAEGAAAVTALGTRVVCLSTPRERGGDSAAEQNAQIVD
jgi:hypothetical protein